jgi:predicted metal-dependent hydrolase
MELDKLLKEVSDKLNLKGEFRIKVKPFKRKIASISHKTGTIYINKTCLEVLTEEEIKFVIAHELLHLKHGKIHTLKFEQELRSLFSKDLTRSINWKIKKLLKSQT